MVFIFAPWPWNLSARAAEKYTPKELLIYSEKHSPNLAQVREQLEAARLRKKNAFLRFLPEGNISYQDGYLGGRNSFQDTLEARRDGVLSLSISENLYDNGQNFNHLERARRTYEISKLEYQLKKNQLALDLIRLYYDYLESINSYEVEELKNSLLEKKYERTAASYRQGRASRGEFLRFKAQLRKSELTLKVQKNAILLLKYRLFQTAGVPYKENWESGGFDIEALPLTEFSRIVLPGNRPDLERHLVYQISALQMKNNALQLRLAEREFWPSLSITSSVDIRTDQNYLGLSHWRNESDVAWNALLRVDFNFLDWGIRRHNIGIARSELNSSNFQINESILSLKERLSAFSRNFTLVFENLKLSYELRNLEEQNYRQIEEDFRLGKASFLDIVSVLENFVSSKVAYYQNYYGFQKALAELHFHEGDLYQRILDEKVR